MFCNQCGNKIPDGGAFCPNCGHQMKNTRGGEKQFSVSHQKQSSGVDSIFNGLLYEKNMGTYLEFGIWVAVCVLAVMFLLAAVLVDGDIYVGGKFRTLWIFMLIFAVGYGVLLAFRQRIIAIYYSGVIFFLCLFIPFFNCEKSMFSSMLESVEKDEPAVLWVLFVFGLLISIGLITCLSIHIFSNFNLELPVLILGIAMTAMVIFTGIGSYAIPRYSYEEACRDYLESKDYNDAATNRVVDNRLDAVRENYGKVSNGLGTTSYVLLCFISGAYLILFYRGMIDNRKQKILLSGFYEKGGQSWQNSTNNFQRQQRVVQQERPVYYHQQPAIQFLSGEYAGKMVGLSGEVILGSEQGKVHIVLRDNMVSRQHCVIRFNSMTGNYEVRDLSKNGVFLQNGVRLQQGVTMACARGTVLYLGSRNQQICLI